MINTLTQAKIYLWELLIINKLRKILKVMFKIILLPNINIKEF
jgi:hypothetical protein